MYIEWVGIGLRVSQSQGTILGFPIVSWGLTLGSWELPFRMLGVSSGLGMKAWKGYGLRVAVRDYRRTGYYLVVTSINIEPYSPGMTE